MFLNKKNTPQGKGIKISFWLKRLRGLEIILDVKHNPAGKQQRRVSLRKRREEAISKGIYNIC